MRHLAAESPRLAIAVSREVTWLTWPTLLTWHDMTGAIGPEWSKSENGIRILTSISNKTYYNSWIFIWILYYSGWFCALQSLLTCFRWMSSTSWMERWMCSMVAAAWREVPSSMSYSMSIFLQTISSLIAFPNFLPRHRGFRPYLPRIGNRSLLEVSWTYTCYNVYFTQLLN